MSLNNMSKAERTALFESQGDDSNALVAQQLLEMKADTGYGKRLLSVAATYNSATNKCTFPVNVHYISIYSASDLNFMFNATDDTDASNKLSSPSSNTEIHFLSGGERLNFGVPQMPISRIDFLSVVGTAEVYITGFTKAETFDD